MIPRVITPLSFISVFALSACLASNPVKEEEFEQYKSAPIGDAEILPSESALKGERVKVIVLDSDDSGDAIARTAKVSSTMAQAVAGVLSSGTVEIVDNKIDSKLAEALRIAESQGASSYSGPKVADFAIKVVVTNADYTSSFQSETAMTDNKTGKKTVLVPAGYNHVGEVTANVRVFTLPGLKQVESIKIAGKSVQFDPKQNHSQAIGTQVVAKAASAAPETYRADLLREFASKGYVSARRANGKKNIFLVTMGREQGVKAGDDVRIFALRREEQGNLAGGESETEEVLIAEGTVTEKVTGKQAWVYVSDEQKARKILRGHLVKTHHTDGIMDKIKKKGGVF